MITVNFEHDFWFENIEARPHPWPGLAWITAMLAVPDVTVAQKLYSKLFGLATIFESKEEDGTTVFARLRYRGCNITLNREGRFNLPTQAPVTTGTMPPFVLYLYVDDVNATYEKALSEGCVSITEPRTEPWGDLIARVQDPLGYLWELAMRI
jgi:PhnB protein